MPARVWVIACLFVATGCAGGGFSSPVIPSASPPWYTPEYSALFRPFVAPKPLALVQMLVLGYFLFVALYLVGRRLGQNKIGQSGNLVVG